MENKLFENAYFGKPYKTRGGYKAILLQKTFNIETGKLKGFIVATNDWRGTYCSYPIDLDGKMQCWSHQRPEDLTVKDDIVEEWKEPVDEENLNRLTVAEYPLDDGIEESHWNTQQFKLREAYKAGYRKAKE